MSRTLTRRAFIKGTCVSALLGGVLPEIPLPPDPLPGEIETNSLSLVVNVKSRKDVVKGLTPDISLVKQMVETGITSLTGANNPKDAWKSLFHEDERIGIKINGLGAHILAGNYQICRAIVDALKEIGVNENNIIIWDQYQHHLLSSGFKLNMSFKGVRVFATDRGGGEKALDAGSSHKEYDRGYSPFKKTKI